MNSPFNQPSKEDKEAIRKKLVQQLEELNKPEEQKQDLDKYTDALISIHKMATISVISSVISVCLLLVVMLWLTFG